MYQHNPAQLGRAWRSKQIKRPAAQLLGDEALSLFQHDISRQHKKVGGLSEAWQTLVPPMLSDHCTLSAFSRGTLTVLVDSSSFMYELKQLMLAGLEAQLLLACRGQGLRKVQLKRG